MFSKVLIYGENWTGTLPRLLHDELVRRGYSVQLFDFTTILPGIRNRSLGQRIRRRLFSGYFASRIRAEFRKTVATFAPDLIIVAKGLHLDRPTLESVRERGVTLVNWNPDDFFNLKNSSKGLIETMPTYDVIISSRDHLFDAYKAQGVKRLLYLDWYYVPELHYDHHLPVSIDASFVGSWSPFREEFIGRLNTRLKVWGGGWEKSSREFRSRHDVQKKILTQVEMSRVFSGSRFNLNLLTHENSDYSNLRFFEVPASGGLLVTPRNGSAGRYLVDGDECLMYSSVDEVNELLCSDRDFAAIARAGNKRITEGHNAFSDRVDELMRFLECQL